MVLSLEMLVIIILIIIILRHYYSLVSASNLAAVDQGNQAKQPAAAEEAEDGETQVAIWLGVQCPHHYTGRWLGRHHLHHSIGSGGGGL